MTPKSLAYVTWRGQLLVLRHPDHADAGVQIPGGSIEPGESAEAAALRETREETGLQALTLEGALGTAEYVLKVDRGPPHLRHFFHVSFDGASPERWYHMETRANDGQPAVRFELSWEELGSVHLDWEMDAFLHVVRQRCDRER